MTDRSDFDLALHPDLLARIEADYAAFRASQQGVLAAMSARYGDTAAMYRRPCPLCGADQPRPRFVKAGLEIVTCARCGMEYSHNVLREEHDRGYYAQDPTGFVPALAQLRQHPVYRELDLRRAAYLVESLRRAGVPADGRLLDVGAGHGALVEVAAAAGLRAEGLELSPVLAEDCRQRGLQVRTGAFPEAVGATERFDAIVLLDVLEHLVEPGVALGQLCAHLAPRGVLAIQVPNMASLLVTLEGEDNSNYGYGHWSYFTPATLGRLLRDAGLRVLALETYVSELHRVQRRSTAEIRAALDRLGCNGLDPGALSAPQLLDHDLGYKLFAIAAPAG